MTTQKQLVRKLCPKFLTSSFPEVNDSIGPQLLNAQIIFTQCLDHCFLLIDFEH